VFLIRELGIAGDTIVTLTGPNPLPNAH
jgi:hypothetical protein